MKGKWFYLAGISIIAILLAFTLHWIVFMLLFLLVMRIILIKEKLLIILTIGVGSFFFIFAMHKEEARGTSLTEDEQHFTIIFTEMPTIDGNKLKGVVKTANHYEKILLDYQIDNEAEKQWLDQNILPGTTCQLTGSLLVPEKNRNKYLFNYKQYLYRKNIHWILQPTAIASELCANNTNRVAAHLLRIRLQGLNRITSYFSERVQPYAMALIFGDRSDFDNETYEMYQRLGVVHLLAISGLHIGLITAVIYYLLLRVGVSRESIYFMLMIFLPFYTLLSGGNPPVIRASLMTMLLLSASRWKLPITVLDALSISLLLFLIINPYALYNIGFQLSYVVSFSLVISAYHILPRYTSFAANLLAITFISSLSALPILIFHYFEFPLFSLFTNVIYVPFYSFVILPLIFIAFFATFIHPALVIRLVNMIEFFLVMSEYVGHHIAHFRFATIVTGRPSAWILLFMFIAIFYLFVHWERRRSILIAIIPLIFVLLIQLGYQQYKPYGEVIFIDVGQGDSILIRLPYNRGTYLVDTGGISRFTAEEWKERKNNFRVGKDILLPFLKSKAITTIDKLIVTHSHYDHMGAASELINKMNIRKIYLSPGSKNNPIMADLLQSAAKKKTPLYEVKDGFSWKNKSASFLFLYPFEKGEGENNDSLVLYAIIGGKSWLFTGDLEKEGENDIIKKYEMQVDVLKVGHHGSKTSTTEAFLTHMKPKYAVISVGKNNLYGHPHSDVMQLLSSNNIRIYRTDLHGAIHYTFYRENGTFFTLLP